MSLVEIWAILGVGCIVAEFFISGIGFLFLGFGALSTSAVAYNYSLTSFSQYILLTILSFSWFVLFWFFFKKKRRNDKDTNSQYEYSDMIGAEVEVYQPISGKLMGQVKWSGTIMNAQLNDNTYETVGVGKKLYIQEVKGNILICSTEKLLTKKKGK